jgi:hypothetical protein
VKNIADFVVQQAKLLLNLAKEIPKFKKDLFLAALNNCA